MQAPLESHLISLALRHASAPLSFRDGERIVSDGRFAFQNELTSYAAVPLCVIQRGAVTILENGKAVKHLHSGEYFGVFETAYALRFGTSARVGRWSLVADGATDVVPLSLSEVKPLADDLSQIAIESAVPQPNTRLPLLDRFASELGITQRDDTIIFYHSHLLESTFDLLKHLGALAGYHNVFVLEKPYSTIDRVFMNIARAGIRTYPVKIIENAPYEYSLRHSVDFVWDLIAQHARTHGIRRIICLSDGGDILLRAPHGKLEGISVAGIEQTMRGLDRIRNARLAIPVVNVASSDAKKNLESPVIAESVCAKLAAHGFLGAGKKIGVIGNGAIGRSVFAKLIGRGETAAWYDKTYGHASPVRSLEELVASSDLLIGTTGTDALRGLFTERLRGEKIFASASSSNVEFAFLFDLAKRSPNSFEDVRLAINGECDAIILNGGYPINFDRTAEWEPLEDIQLTRALLYAGIRQAIASREINGIHELKPEWQRRITKLWEEQKKYACPRD